MDIDEDKAKMRRSYALLINAIHDMGFHGIEENKDGWETLGLVILKDEGV